jgi:hypothetical protein
MRLQFWSGHLFAVGLTAVVLQLTGCGAGEGGTDPPAATRSKSSASSAADSSSADLINAALARGEIGAETALTFKAFALFGDAHLPTRYQGAAGDESESDALEEVSSRFGSLSAATQQALAPYLRRPADLGSWASPELGAKRLETETGCKGQAARWAAVNPDAGGKVKVWYDTAVAGDQAAALAVSAAIDAKVWPALMDGGARPVPSDASPAGCDGGDARLDVYLVHGLRARGVTVPAHGPDPSAVFALVNADSAPDTTVNAALGVMNAIQYARRIGTDQTSTGDRKRALARSAAGSTRTTAAAAAVAAQPVPSVVQLKAASMTTAVVSVTLDLPVTAGNWLAIAVSTIGASPANVALSDNQSHGNLNFASAGQRYVSSLGTTWRYVKLTATGTYTLSVDRAAASSGSVQILELANVDPTTLLDIAAVGSSGNSAEAAGTFRTATTTNDLLLSVVAVRSSTVTISPTSPTGSALSGSIRSGAATSGVFAVNTSAPGMFRMAASLVPAGPWRMSSLAVRGASAAPVVVAPANTALPAITVTDNGTFLGLATSLGTWANGPTAYAYSWTRNGAAIPGATMAGYNTTQVDQGNSIAAVVTASNSAGVASATSAAVPIPVPTSSAAPAVALTASPQSVTQGQPSTLTWSSTNATSCVASGAWSGARAVSGSVSVTPTIPSAFALDCVGPGGTATASASVDVTAAPPESNPTLGAHGLVFHISKGSVGPTLSTPAMTTQPGSTLLAFVGKGSIYNLGLPFDNKGNKPYVQIGAIHEYTKWPGEGTAMYAFNSIVGGTNHLVSIDDSNVWDEVTFSTVEVRNGGVVQDFKWNEVLNSAAQTSLSVTTTGPATLVAVWYGDDASSTPANPVPNNGFAVIEGNGNATESVQMFVATKNVAAAGTYNVTWNTTPLQGAQLYLVAVQKR